MTDAEIRKLAHQYLNGTGDHCIIQFAHAVIVAAREKNTYPNMCRDEHPQIGHLEDDCPICYPADDLPNRRAAFEAHFFLNWRQVKRTHDDSMYIDKTVQAKWEGYQAGVAKAAPVADDATRELVALRYVEQVGWRPCAKDHIDAVYRVADVHALLAAAAPVAVPDDAKGPK